jgi:hypothetical protein
MGVNARKKGNSMKTLIVAVFAISDQTSRIIPKSGKSDESTSRRGDLRITARLARYCSPKEG